MRVERLQLWLLYWPGPLAFNGLQLAAVTGPDRTDSQRYLHCTQCVQWEECRSPFVPPLIYTNNAAEEFKLIEL